MNHGRACAARARGMTLIEILVVLVLIGIVMGIVAGNFIGQGEEAKRKAGEDRDRPDRRRRSTCTSSRSAATRRRRKACRRSITAPSGVNNWNGPYWKKTHGPEGPVGQRYQYTAPGDKAPYDIVSLRRRRQGRRRWPRTRTSRS